MNNVQIVETSVVETGGRRLGIERRQFSYSGYIPERRVTVDRRNGIDRRVNYERRLAYEV